MESSSRAKLLGALLGMVFLGSVAFLIFQGQKEEAAESEAKDKLGKAVRAEKRLNASGQEYPRCPECGRELSATGECPFCAIKKHAAAAEGKPLAEEVPRLGRYFAWSMIGTTVLLGTIHLSLIIRQRRRSLRPPEDDKLKTRCAHCKRRVSFPPRLAGTYGSCPTCRNRIKFDPIAYEH
jgi:hypothetical protein